VGRGRGGAGDHVDDGAQARGGGSGGVTWLDSGT
jgi:hypothetical protein